MCAWPTDKFCNLRITGHATPYTDIETYKSKIDETFVTAESSATAGRPSPRVGLSFYTKLFRELKKLYPTLKACPWASEVAISPAEKSTHRSAAAALQESGAGFPAGAGRGAIA